MTSYEFGDVVRIWFDYTDRSGSKKRPAVIISTASYNDARDDLVMMPISKSEHKSSQFPDVAVKNWLKVGLEAPSFIKPQIATYHQDDVAEKLGRIDAPTGRALKKAIAEILGFRAVPGSATAR